MFFSGMILAGPIGVPLVWRIVNVIVVVLRMIFADVRTVVFFLEGGGVPGPVLVVVGLRVYV